MGEKFFFNLRFFIFPDGLLRKRIQLFEKQISKYGGVVVIDIHQSPPTHVLVEDDLLLNPIQMSKALKSLKKRTQNLECEIVGLKWLCYCLKEKKLLSTYPFVFRDNIVTENRVEENDYISPVKKLRAKSPSPSHRVIESYTSPIDVCPTKKIIINEFQKLADTYRTKGDKWRSLAYDKAISSLKSYSKEITDVNELKRLPHLSAKMLDKISDILENGFSSKAESVCNDEKTKVLELFSKIWGAGPVTAQLWYQKGLRTLEDVEMNGNLTLSQKIGFKYYNEIQDLIPRQEVEEIMQVVKTIAVLLEPSVQFIPCGSFRRGSQLCGDVDILLILNDSINYRSLIPKIIRELKKDGFIIDDLVGAMNTSCSKYLGLCKLKGENEKVRRLDLFAVSEKNSACALMHYTGSALFNRGIRIHASRMNMQLSEFFLKMNGASSKILATPTEESIFVQLGLRYRPPEERQFF